MSGDRTFNDRLEALQAHVAALDERVSALTDENARLRTSLARDAAKTDAPAARSGPLNRRGFLLAAGGAAATAALAARPTPALATNGDPVLAGNSVDATSPTVVTSSSARGLVGRTSATGPDGSFTPSGVVGITFAAAGNNFGDAPSGVLGISSNATGYNFGVRGESSSPQGIGVVGRALNDTGSGTIGMFGQAAGPQGQGVWGLGSIGVRGSATGADAAAGVLGDGALGVLGSGAGLQGVGVRGQAPDGGRGGVFQGDTAQVRLLPSSKKTHPAKGKTGDLFVDAGRRLWFCRGGSAWVRLA